MRILTGPWFLPLLVGVLTIGVLADSRSKMFSPSPKSVSNLHQVAMAMIMYAQDYDDHLPPMKDASTAQKALSPYVMSNDVFFHPDTKEPYQPNSALSNQKFVNPNPVKVKIVAFYQAKPDTDGRRDVLFLPREGDEEKSDYVKSLSETEWLKVKKSLKVP